MRVLFVCEANRSRSPVAAALWTRELTRRGMASSDTVRTDSAGIHAFPGERANHQTSWAAARHGLDLSAHRSRPVDERTIADADLILAMTRDQADHLGMNHRRVSDRMFLVGELAELLRMGAAGEEHPARTATTARTTATATTARTATTTTATTAATPRSAATLIDTATTGHLAEVLRVARTRRPVRGLQDDDVTEPGEDPDAVEAMIARLTADVTTIVQHLIG